MAEARIGLVLDCADPEALGRFWEQAPGLQVAVSIEDTRSYGVGLARALAAAGAAGARVRAAPPQAAPREGQV